VAAVVAGSFSRLGYGRRIAVVAAAAVVVRVIGFAVQAAADGNAALNVVQYLVPVAAAGWAMREIFRQRVSRFIPITASHSRPEQSLAGNPA